MVLVYDFVFAKICKYNKKKIHFQVSKNILCYKLGTFTKNGDNPYNSGGKLPSNIGHWNHNPFLVLHCL